MYENEVEIKNNLGLFARSAMFFIQKANEYKSMIFVEIDNKKVNAKSLLGILSLGVLYGQKIKIIAVGIDEKEAVDSLSDLVEKGFLDYELQKEDEY
ncbi:MAG: HPr family phosphocarrier protein [Oscillospiraceae bacterium]|jgi:phosphocarrier protein|nr:HPr family phosphocarrier protein [Oscillospiraceae bacterium]